MRSTPVTMSMLALLALAACDDSGALPLAGEPAASAQPPAHPPPSSASQAWTIEGFSTPESMVWDERSDLYLVSNINGGAFDRDDNGFISRVSPPPDPRIVDVAWIDGARRDVTLHGPKALALAGDYLYVVDVNAVRRFDRSTGLPRGEVTIPGSFVNDVLAVGDTLYVSVTGLDHDLVIRGEPAIWAVNGDVARKLVAGEMLGGPNGLAERDGAVSVVSFGSGELYQLDGGGRTRGEKLPQGTLDGLVALPDGRFAVSSWEAAGVLVGRDGAWKREPWQLPTPADMGFDAKRGLLLVPSFTEGRVELHPISPP
jgi:hypothetical protein